MTTYDLKDVTFSIDGVPIEGMSGTFNYSQAKEDLLSANHAAYRAMQEYVTRKQTVEEIVSDLDLSLFPVPITLKCVRTGDSIRVYTRMEVKDRSTGKPTKLENHVLFYDIYYETNEERVQFVLRHLRDMFYKLIMHEVDEAFVYRGVRVFDPHKDEK